MSNTSPQPEQLNTAPVQGQTYIPPQYYAPQADEIDLRELFGVLWKGKWWIIGITALFAIASVFYALSIPNEYRATAIVAPASSDSSSNLNRAAGQLGGLATLAGINLGDSDSNDAVIAMEIMKTWEFQESFIKTHKIEVPIYAAKEWNSTDELILDDELYDVANEKWILGNVGQENSKPTSWMLHKAFRAGLVTSKDKNSGLYSISYIHKSPYYAQKITSWLIEDINMLMKKRALSDATSNIQYLENQISKTSLSDMQGIFYSLIQEQTKTKMLAEVSDEYVFKIVSQARVPQEKFAPKRSIICILAVLLGSGLSIVLVIFLNMFVWEKKASISVKSDE